MRLQLSPEPCQLALPLPVHPGVLYFTSSYPPWWFIRQPRGVGLPARALILSPTPSPGLAGQSPVVPTSSLSICPLGLGKGFLGTYPQAGPLSLLSLSVPTIAYLQILLSNPLSL